MKAKLERRKYSNNEHVWIGKYQNLNNSEHWHIDHEIVYCESGSCCVQCDGRTLLMQANDVAFFTSGTIHSLSSVQDTILYVGIFDEHLDSGLFSCRHLCEPVFPAEDELIHSILNLYKIYQSKPQYYQVILSSIATILCAQIAGEQATEKTDLAYYTDIERYRKLLSWIDSHYSSLTFEEAAEVIGFSPAYFSRYFKRMCGTTFSQYVNFVRIENAIDLLHDRENSVSSVASLTGFDTIRNFNRVFKTVTGYTPKNMPKDFDLNFSQFETTQEDFDPTSKSSILL